ncbi:uncharacterized protein EAF01_002376 [Botrytis porri]|uniref:uncharacterized protein n=1 Tax=Botrytis porri TaxID=87229 RepID=UPI0019005580|nr:uncharacterized protein EAF01_002376 [Botrytis porri]KAF7910867.1 hypothetical protein EAF01_002376 [Botrytis porri]
MLALFRYLDRGYESSEIKSVESPRLLRESVPTVVKLPEAHQISAIPQNATLALSQTFHPQIFQIPLSTCLSSTSETHRFSSALRIVTPPTCPPELPKLWTLMYAKPGCLDPSLSSPTEHSYPLYRSLFQYVSRANPSVDG